MGWMKEVVCVLFSLLTKMNRFDPVETNTNITRPSNMAARGSLRSPASHVRLWSFSAAGTFRMSSEEVIDFHMDAGGSAFVWFHKDALTSRVWWFFNVSRSAEGLAEVFCALRKLLKALKLRKHFQTNRYFSKMHLHRIYAFSLSACKSTFFQQIMVILLITIINQWTTKFAVKLLSCWVGACLKPSLLRLKCVSDQAYLPGETERPEPEGQESSSGAPSQTAFPKRRFSANGFQPPATSWHDWTKLQPLSTSSGTGSGEELLCQVTHIIYVHQSVSHTWTHSFSTHMEKEGFSCLFIFFGAFLMFHQRVNLKNLNVCLTLEGGRFTWFVFYILGFFLLSREMFSFPKAAFWYWSMQRPKVSHGVSGWRLLRPVALSLSNFCKVIKKV